MRIRCNATLFSIGTRTILRLPGSASAKLPSRGMVFAEGVLNGIGFRLPLEPDGRGSHWCSPDSDLLRAVNASAGDDVALEIEPIADWPDPAIPGDLKRAFAADPRAGGRWRTITPMARWEWIRWIRSTGEPETRKRRISAACDKLGKGERRPCCFNRALCTDPAVSRGGVLLDPDSHHGTVKKNRTSGRA